MGKGVPGKTEDQPAPQPTTAVVCHDIPQFLTALPSKRDPSSKGMELREMPQTISIHCKG